MVKSGEITSINEILNRGLKIIEPEVVDMLIPGLKSDLIKIGQAKGKFGGGQRRPFRRTQKKVREGSRNTYTYLSIIGDGNGYIGIGKGSSRESMLARQRALINAKRNIQYVFRGCGDWECGCKTTHSLPFTVEGKSASIRMVLKPAPKGTGLVIGDEGKKMLKLVGIKDAWSETYGETRTRINYAYALFDALKNIKRTKIPEKYMKMGGVQ
ncbi:MAG: 30S ribosomal protein S5 [Candidatus Altiarchaeota archaeon]|nr:30S ribosomal protein S5 [Candidatus Altiarchaeota archaeon]